MGCEEKARLAEDYGVATAAFAEAVRGASTKYRDVHECGI